MAPVVRAAGTTMSLLLGGAVAAELPPLQAELPPLQAELDELTFGLVSLLPPPPPPLKGRCNEGVAYTEGG